MWYRAASGCSRDKALFLSIPNVSVTKKIELGRENSFLREYDFITVKPFVSWVILQLV